MEDPSYDYIVFIDESGDDGIAKVKPLHENGSSEWLVLSAIVVRAERGKEVIVWRDEIKSNFKNHQTHDIHFNRLSDAKKRYLCSYLADKPARFFAVISNKQNMQGHRNPRAEKVPSRNWFYCWVIRVLMERVTQWVGAHSLKEYGIKKKALFVFSNRGGMSYSQLKAYFSWLRTREEADTDRFPGYQVDWDVVSTNLIRVYPHKDRAGLQLADAIAGAAFKSCDFRDTGEINTEFIERLKPRFAWHPCDHQKNIAGFGLKLMPDYFMVKITDEQRKVFDLFGYPNNVWRPPTPS